MSACCGVKCPVIELSLRFRRRQNQYLPVRRDEMRAAVWPCARLGRLQQRGGMYIIHARIELKEKCRYDMADVGGDNDL